MKNNDRLASINQGGNKSCRGSAGSYTIRNSKKKLDKSHDSTHDFENDDDEFEEDGSVKDVKEAK